MSELGNIDRPPVTFRYDPWGRDVTARRLGARQLLEWRETLQVAQEGTQDDQAKAFAGYLAHTMVEPTASQDEWYDDVSLPTLIDLAGQVMQQTGLDVGQKKSG